MYVANAAAKKLAQSLSLFLVLGPTLQGCHSQKRGGGPSIEFTHIPPAAQGGPERVDRISGWVRNARPNQQIVIYVHRGQWWVQPLPDHLIPIKADSTWSTETPLGFEYAALLVEPDYHPLPTMDVAPTQSGSVALVTIVKGVGAPQAAPDQSAKIPPGTYQLTCEMSSMSGNNLRAMCQTRNGDWLTTELHNPDGCVEISNQNGKLTCTRGKTVWPGSYVESCKDIRVHNNMLVARCKNIQGKWVVTSFKDLRTCTGDIRNDSGQLTCVFQTEANQTVEALTPPAGRQFIHETWRFKDGAPENVNAVAQTPDGFLWLGGASGLFRFDGRQFELFHSPFGDELLSTNIYSLLAPASGGLWIGYTFGGISFLDKGRVKNYGGDFAADSGTIHCMARDGDGAVWAATSSGLWRFSDSHWQHIGTEWNVPITNAEDVWLDRDANLWVQGEGKLLYLHRGSRQFQQNVTPRTSHFLTTQRLVDQEGSVWFASMQGLDRFSYSPLVKQELPGQGGFFGLAADNNGMVWVGGLGPPLYRVVHGRTKVLPKYPSWIVASMYRAPDGTIWLGENNGLWHETFSQRPPTRNPKESKIWFDMRQALWRFTGRDWEMFALPREVASQGWYLQAITQDRAGGIWVSLGRHGLYRLADGVWTPYGGRIDLPKTGVVCEFTDSLGRVWFGYLKNQLAVLVSGRVQVFGSGDGIGVGNITAIQGRGPKVWIGGEFGLLQFDAGHFNKINAVRNEWLRGISGIAETANGDLWINGIAGIFHVPHSELVEALNDSSYQVKGEHFGRHDGLTGTATQIRPLPSAIEASDGRIWFATTGGVVSVDPTHAEKSSTPSPITIQSVSADGKAYDRTFPLNFAPRTSSVQIDYSAVSLADPETIRFRYRLQEADQDWHEVVTASSVTYRNLPPGLYHFRVNATGRSGLWSDKIATMEFSISPAFYQTMWFRSLCMLAFLVLLVGLYRMRLSQLARQYNARLEERVSERTRIARELHDTLLQSFQGLLMRFQAVSNELADGEAKQELDGAIDRAARAITEGRDAVQGLRSSAVESTDLAAAIVALAKELSAADTRSPEYTTQVEGAPRELHPVLRDEVYRMAGEALRNAFRHADAQHIEVEIRYDEQRFRLRVRDDGNGIDPKLLVGNGRAGHFGLRGMRERAERVGGKLTVWSEPQSGTELELSIPAVHAYTAFRAARRGSRFAKKLSGKDREIDHER